MTESDILYQQGKHWVTTSKSAGREWEGFVVYRDELTHAVLVSSIGHTGDYGLKRAIQECERREQQL